jgi:hypothetical protein
VDKVLTEYMLKRRELLIQELRHIEASLGMPSSVQTRRDRNPVPVHEYPCVNMQLGES